MKASSATVFVLFLLASCVVASETGSKKRLYDLYTRELTTKLDPPGMNIWQMLKQIK